MVKISLKPGTYVLAVSGGVDSVVLLHLITHDSYLMTQCQFIVAHFDHGIRSNSADDEKFVRKLASQYGLVFESSKGDLGPEASEALARQKRYEFLRKAAVKHRADGIITAHHKDDAIETAILNILRGTDRLGLSSLRPESGDLHRPLLGVYKKEILAYAKTNSISWVEDETNSSDKYLRNRVRKALDKANPEVKSAFEAWLAGMERLNDQIDLLMGDFLKQNLDANGDVVRSKFIALDHNLAREFVAVWLRMFEIEFDRKLLEKLVIDLKVGKIHAEFDIDKHHYFSLGSKQISLRRR